MADLAIQEHRWFSEGTLNVLVIAIITSTFRSVCSFAVLFPLGFGGALGPAQGLVLVGMFFWTRFGCTPTFLIIDPETWAKPIYNEDQSIVR